MAEVNKHIPHEVLGERWSIAYTQSWPMQTAGYDMEQHVLNSLSSKRTEGERVLRAEDELRDAWVDTVHKLLGHQLQRV